jgi:hypothetical protein
MIKCIFLLLFILLSFSTQAQKSYLFQILEQNSTKPVSYATIYAKVQKDGVTANEQGFFELQATENDTLVITCIGYKTANFVLKSLVSNQKIFLETDISELESVTITPNKKEKKVVSIGYFKKRIGSMAHKFSNFTNTENAIFIEDSTYMNHKIIDIRLNRHKGTLYTNLFKLCMYSVKEEKPDKNLLTREVIFSDEDIVNNKVIVPIEEMNLIFPKEGVFVSIQAIGFIDKKTGLIRSKQFLYKKDKNDKSDIITGTIGYTWFVKNLSKLPHYTRGLQSEKWINIDNYLGTNSATVETIGLGVEE